MKRFIHIPKTAGISVVNWLRENNIEVLYGKNCKSIHLKTNKVHKPASYFKNEPTEKFSIVRNPFTRIISFYNFTKDEDWHPSFEEFVITKSKNPNTRFPSPWTLQAHWLTDQNKLIVNKLIKLENLDNELCEYFNCYTPVNKKNQSTFNNYKSYYNSQQLIDIVKKHFQNDFILLNYDTSI